MPKQRTTHREPQDMIVIWRTGGHDNFQWHRSQPMPPERALTRAVELERLGIPAFAGNLDAPLPTMFECGPEPVADPRWPLPAAQGGKYTVIDGLTRDEWIANLEIAATETAVPQASNTKGSSTGPRWKEVKREQAGHYSVILESWPERGKMRYGAYVVEITPVGDVFIEDAKTRSKQSDAEADMRYFVKKYAPTRSRGN